MRGPLRAGGLPRFTSGARPPRGGRAASRPSPQPPQGRRPLAASRPSVPSRPVPPPVPAAAPPSPPHQLVMSRKKAQPAGLSWKPRSRWNSPISTSLSVVPRQLNFCISSASRSTSMPSMALCGPRRPGGRPAAAAAAASAPHGGEGGSAGTAGGGGGGAKRGGEGRGRGRRQALAAPRKRRSASREGHAAL